MINDESIESAYRHRKPYGRLCVKRSEEDCKRYAQTKREAKQGDPDAQHQLGLMYFLALGVPKDCKLEVYWYKKAAEQGHAVAQYNLGVMLSIGRGVPKDLEKAAYWYKKSAAQGDAAAQNNLMLLKDSRVVKASRVVRASRVIC